jgi:tetratricopeptide (TPR) repeat protein
MKRDKAFVRDIAIAGILLLCIVVVGIVRATRQPVSQEETAVAVENPKDLDGVTQELLDSENRPERRSSRQVVLDQIAKHEEKIAQNPTDTEVPAYQLAIANLYVTKLGDYESASVYLERLIEQSPDSNLVSQAYVKLAKCYESLGWQSVADATYKRMMDHFPEDSANYEYARAKQSRTQGIY